MRSFVKWNLVILALAVGLACATGAYADTLDWSISGSGWSGTGTMTIIPFSGTYTALNGCSTNCSVTYIPGDGWDQVTAMTGSLNYSSLGGSVVLLLVSGLGSTTLYNYDNLINPTGTPELDLFGLVFTAGISGSGGFANPLELCADPGCETPYSSGGGTQAWIWDYPNGDNAPTSEYGYGAYYAFPVTFTTTAVPEPSVLSLLTLGLLG